MWTAAGPGVCASKHKAGFSWLLTAIGSGGVTQQVWFSPVCFYYFIMPCILPGHDSHIWKVQYWQELTHVPNSRWPHPNLATCTNCITVSPNLTKQFQLAPFVPGLNITFASCPRSSGGGKVPILEASWILRAFPPGIAALHAWTQLLNCNKLQAFFFPIKQEVQRRCSRVKDFIGNLGCP